jgi:RHS repeat-associated protein
LRFSLVNEHNTQPAYFDDFEIVHKPNADKLSVTSWAEYYAFGKVAKASCPSNGAYRYGYQGEFAEKDSETDWNSFELRQYDSEIGRFTTTDPMGEFWSSYVGMGNNPSNLVDPTGGCTSCYGSLAGLSESISQMQAFYANGGLGEIGGGGFGFAGAATITFPTVMRAIPAAGGAALGDGPFPVGDAVGVGIIVGALTLDMWDYFSKTKPKPVAIPTTHAIANNDEEENYVTIYRAPQKGTGQKQYTMGFNPVDFLPTKTEPWRDGKVYFAAPNSRSIAVEYSQSYGEGILQVHIPKAIYDVHFKYLERPYQGEPIRRELPIPVSLFPILNSFLRTYSPF